LYSHSLSKQDHYRVSVSLRTVTIQREGYTYKPVIALLDTSPYLAVAPAEE